MLMAAGGLVSSETSRWITSQKLTSTSGGREVGALAGAPARIVVGPIDDGHAVGACVRDADCARYGVKL